MKFFLLLFASLFFLPVLYARPVELRVTDYGWLTSFQPLKDSLDFYLQGEENKLNADQPILNPSRVNSGTANASVLASKGLGTDYVDDPKKFSISLGLGAAIDNEKNVAIKDQISGAAGASSVTLGYRLDPKLMGYVNLGTFMHKEIIPGDFDIAGDIDSTNLGVHLRYDLVEKKGSEWFGWGGLKLHTGYEYNSNRVTLSTKLDEPLELDTGGSGVLSGRLVGTPEYEVRTETHSLPLELSTSFLFLKVMSFYTGFGTDFNFGRSVGKGNLKGDVTGLACSSGICVSETVLPQVEARANFNSRSTVRSVTYRVFGGFQLDLPLGLHAYVQAEQMLGTRVIGASSGLKYTF